MKVTEIVAPDFNLAMTLNSGQTFHWKEIGKGFYGSIDQRSVYCEQKGSTLLVKGASAKVVAQYFALDHSLTQICDSFPNDPTMNAARNYCRGLRIMRQPKWECLATFICSSMKQVAHIRQIVGTLRQRFGDRAAIDNQTIYLFPNAKRIAAATEIELRKCALGYRAKNLLATARLVASGRAKLDAWSRLSDDDLGTELCQLPGVGPKIANCVMLFAYERLSAFPVDVWIARVLEQGYGAAKFTASKRRSFAQEYFGDHAGYAQQYLFHHARTTRLGSKESFRAATAAKSRTKSNRLGLASVKTRRTL